MSDSERPPTTTKDATLPEQDNRGAHQIPTPPRSSEELHDYSDAPSVDSEHSRPQQRRHQRGGRKPKQTGGRKAQSCAGCGIHCAQAQEHEEEEEEEEQEEEQEDNAADDYDQQSLRNARSRKSAGAKPKLAPKSDTGFKVFNLERAEASGGRRPFGVTVDRPESRSNTQRASQEEHSQQERKEEPQKEERKPVSIRLDLNLELEIFLRAKIKGDITITFLE